MNNPLTITPANEADWLAMRKLDVTSTESAALFGMSPYMTHFELWHAKKSGQARAFVANERMKWGNRLEAAIAHGIAEEQGWTVEPMKDYMRLPELRAGSSFDFRITSLGEPAHLEIKNVDYLAFRDGWIEHDDGSIEAPEHIEMQVQHQMMVSGYKRSFIGAFIAGNRGVVIERQRDEQVIAAMRQRIADFWHSVDANQEPAAVMPGDAEAVIRLNQYAQPGKILDASTDANIALLVTNYKRASQDEKNAQEDKETAKALLLEAIGDAEKVLVDGWTISAGIQAETPPTVITADMIGQTYGGRKGFRNLRINARKPK
jgi:putative phage-type endonuclease